ncbi:hypothetical protein M422DRAFT_31221 [Sphaerobolus stellatus SS14]|uniref:Lysophospholipase n=1 Tax=Sphaerobolus stellatus (strain SS14) TaxID=990650 RepID=A0A0C9VLJ6_SPHS4|nr:hypothetical protein M422DRAFT_31221 [Sphaerobolus stellatus SS14]
MSNQDNVANKWADSYAPSTKNSCPETILRKIPSTAQSLSSEESRYLTQRESTISTAWHQLLQNATLGYNLAEFSQFPRVGMAIGGAGFRGALFGQAVLSAFSDRSATARSKRDSFSLAGGVGLAYSGSAGGSFLNPGKDQDVFQFRRALSSSGFMLNMDMVTPGGNNILSQNNQHYYGSILSNVYSKGQAGFQPSLTDIWSRMLSYHIVNGTTPDNFYTNETSHGADSLLSDLLNQPAFQDNQAPFPIYTLHTQDSNQEQDGSGVIYEISPFEMGSYESTLNAMVQTKYLGTRLNEDGSLNGDCVTGFDQVGFVSGTSSNPFYNPNDGNQPNVTGFDSDAVNAFNYLLGKLKDQVKSQRYDVGNWPNPFMNINKGTYQEWNQEWLNLGSAKNYIPIEPLMVKARNMSVIVAIDATGETTDNLWPDGTAMQNAAKRIQTILNETHQAFPPIPKDFLGTGVTLHPTFFGCNATALSDYPMIIYIPNAPPADGSDPVTNPDGFKTSYSQEHQDLFYDQSYMSATGGYIPNRLGSDPNFLNCLKCATIDRARLMAQPPIVRSQTCQTCFDRYCYNPDNQPSSKAIVGRKLVFTDPDLKNEGFLQQHRVQLGVGIAAAVVALLVIIVAFIFWRRRSRSHTSRRRGIPPILNTGAAKYAPIHDEGDVWSSHETAYDPAVHQYEMSPPSQYDAQSPPSQDVHYRDPYAYNPSPGFTPRTPSGFSR